VRRANAAAALSKAISNDRRSRSGKAYVMTTANTLVFIDERFVTRNMIETDADAEKSAAERVTTPVVGSKAHQNPNMDCCNRKAHDMMARGWIFCAAYYIPRDLPREK